MFLSHKKKTSLSNPTKARMSSSLFQDSPTGPSCLQCRYALPEASSLMSTHQLTRTFFSFFRASMVVIILRPATNLRPPTFKFWSRARNLKSLMSPMIWDCLRSLNRKRLTWSLSLSDWKAWCYYKERRNLHWRSLNLTTTRRRRLLLWVCLQESKRIKITKRGWMKHFGSSPNSSEDCRRQKECSDHHRMCRVL